MTIDRLRSKLIPSLRMLLGDGDMRFVPDHLIIGKDISRVIEEIVTDDEIKFAFPVSSTFVMPISARQQNTRQAMTGRGCDPAYLQLESQLRLRNLNEEICFVSVE